VCRYVGSLGASLLLALSASAILVALNVTVVIAFFQKRRLFPQLFYIFAIINALAPFVLVVAASAASGRSLSLDALREHAFSILIFAFWTAYIRLSKQVRETFVN
jgi:hypothetical protein